MLSPRLEEVLKGNYSILNSKENGELAPDRVGLLKGSYVKLFSDSVAFNFGYVADYGWFDGGFQYPPYTVQDVGGAIYIYAKDRSHEKMKALEERLRDSLRVSTVEDLPLLEVLASGNIEFCLTLISQKIRGYIPNEEEVEQLIEVAKGDSSFPEQIAAIEILSNSRSLRAYHFLNQLIDYQISVETISEQMEELFPSFFEDATGHFEKTWTCSGISKKIRDYNDIPTPHFKEGKVHINFVNVGGSLEKELNRTIEAQFYPDRYIDKQKGPGDRNYLMRCDFNHLRVNFWHLELYRFIFNAQLRIRRNLGEDFDKEKEFKRISFFGLNTAAGW